MSSRDPASSHAEWCQRVETALGAGEPLPAYDLATEALARFPADVRLRQLLMLALARSGATLDAQRLAHVLESEGHRDEETLGLLARTHKDLAASAADPQEARRHREDALIWYQRAFEVSRGPWSGINVATLAKLLDRRDEAERLAKFVKAACLDRIDGLGTTPDYWLLATLGEACLLLDEVQAAEDWYGRAVALASRRLGDRVATRKNARLLLRHAGADPARYDRTFAVPTVVVCAGHLIDRPGRRDPRFPTELEDAVQHRVRERLDAVDAGIGFASAACGADLIALECLRERNAVTHIVLPYQRDSFVPDSVAITPDSPWVERFERAVSAAAEVIVASEHRMGRGGASYEYAFRLLDGVAAVRAAELETNLTGLAVWDGKPGDGAGGTASAVAHWRRLGRPIEFIDLAQILHDRRGTVVLEPPADAPDLDPAHAVLHADARFSPSVVALLFADVVGFSQLTDVELPTFVEEYLGLVAKQLGTLDPPPRLTNTWGDGLYVVFEDVGQAGRFALQLCEAVRRTDWQARGFRGPLDVRVGLHAGLAYACTDPVTGRLSYVGAHVSRAARIEPVTPPGAVYASRPFAALARADGVLDFVCDYVGTLPLAKGFGAYPMYIVRAR